MKATITNQGETMYEPKVAAKIAADAQANDDSWTYSVENPAGPFTRIAIRDEEGELVGYL